MIIDDEVFDNLDFEEVDGQDLNSIVAGLTVAGAEPVDYPDTDGIMLYLRSPAGELIAIEIYSDHIAKEFYIMRAIVPDSISGKDEQ